MALCLAFRLLFAYNSLISPVNMRNATTSPGLPEKHSRKIHCVEFGPLSCLSDRTTSYKKETLLLRLVGPRVFLSLHWLIDRKDTWNKYKLSGCAADYYLHKSVSVPPCYVLNYQFKLWQYFTIYKYISDNVSAYRHSAKEGPSTRVRDLAMAFALLLMTYIVLYVCIIAGESIIGTQMAMSSGVGSDSQRSIQTLVS